MRFISRTGTATVALLSTLLLPLAFSASTYAQGLGEITVDSALNQPLQAHIALLDVSKLDESQIKVALATEAEFTLAHVSRSPNLSQLRFKVEMQKDGTGRILISSTDDIAEPFLDLLVGVTWPNGRTLREYTLLLDLPNNKATTSKANAAVAGSASRASASPSAAIKEYEVQKGDTLYQIAEQTRPSAGVGVQQMMVAIQRANEDSFVNNNVNRIMTGKVLRIPRQDEIALIDQEAAVAQINQQNQELGAQPLAVNDSPGAKGAPARDELTLLSGDQDANGGGSKDLDATIKSLQNQLMLSEESLDRSKLENLELTNRLSAVQEQIDLLQNIIAIEDERIAQLQKQLSSQSAATKDALASVESAAQAAGGGDAGEGILALLSNSVVLLGGLLAMVAGVALMLFIKRRNAQAAMADDEDVSLDELADANDAEPSGGIGAMIAAFMTRFRRAEAEEVEEPVFTEEPTTAPVAAVESVVAKPVPATPPTTDTLLDEMGFSDDFMNLESALDEVESVSEASHPNATPMVEAPPVMPARDTAVDEAGAVMEEAALLEQALDEAEEQAEEEHEDFLQAAAEATPPAAVPETFAFTPDAITEVEEAPAAEPIEDKPEVFEFTLPSLEELDAEDDAVAMQAEDEDKVESISFNTDALKLDSDDSEDDALEVLSFDEDSIKFDDDIDEDGNSNEESSELSGPQDTHDARLDLAVAYEAMGDIDGAVEILEEVIASGKGAQISEAKRLKQKWQNG